MVSGEHHGECGGGEEDLTPDEHSPRVVPVDEDSGDRCPDEGGHTEGGHDHGELTGRRLEVEGGLPPDPDKEGCLTTDP